MTLIKFIVIETISLNSQGWPSTPDPSAPVSQALYELPHLAEVVTFAPSFYA